LDDGGSQRGDRGALAAGASKVLVNDSHWFMRNLLADELHQAAELLSGDPSRAPCWRGSTTRAASMRRCSSGTTPGPARATRSSTTPTPTASTEVRLNGRPVGELGINAALAGVSRVPVAL